MKKIHLSPAQRAAILAAISRYSDRPTFEEYEREETALAAIPTAPKPKMKKIPNTRPGFGARDVVPLPEFNASRDLPEGWAIFSRYDSGGNHGIGNAAVGVWAFVWNSWTPGKPFDLAQRAAVPTGYGEAAKSLLTE